MTAEKRKLFFFISFTAFQVLTPAVAGHIHEDALVLNLLSSFFYITSALLVMFPRVYSSLVHAIVYFGSCNCFMHAEPACVLWAGCVPV